MKKQQVKAILDLMKNTYRDNLNYLQVDLYNDKPVLVATDSYILVALYADESLRDKVGQGMPYRQLEIWYKLATAKSVFEAKDVETEKNDRYPKWQQIIEATKKQATDMLGFNSKLATRLETIAGEQLYYELSGNNGAMKATTDNGLFLLMPLKPKKGA